MDATNPVARLHAFGLPVGGCAREGRLSRTSREPNSGISSVLKTAGLAAIALGLLLVFVARSNQARAQSGSFQAVSATGSQDVSRRIVQVRSRFPNSQTPAGCNENALRLIVDQNPTRSEEHTSELQSRQ